MDRAEWNRGCSHGKRRECKRRTLHEKKCELCDKWFATDHKNQRTCSLHCGQILRGKELRNGRPKCICRQCGAEFDKRTRKRDSNRYCSRACGGTAKGLNEWKAVSDGMLRVLLKHVRLKNRLTATCDVCGRSREQVELRGRLCGACYARSVYVSSKSDEPKKCRVCGGIAYRDGRKTFPAVCSACAAEGRKASAYIAKRLSNKTREQREQVSGAVVRKRAIFARDKWKCQHCGIRCRLDAGPNSPEYPELDHVVPLAKGGLHTPENCQCLCRKCNGEKGSKRESLF